LFGIYINEQEKFLRKNNHADDHYILHTLIAILLIENHVVLLYSSPEGLQMQLGTLTNVYDIEKNVVNLIKTPIMIFNTSKKSLEDFHFVFCGGYHNLHIF
jgi:hypothetical protein